MNRLGLALVAVLLVAATLGALGFYWMGPGGSDALEIVEVTGSVEHWRSDEKREAQVGLRLLPGDELRTDVSGSAIVSRGARSPIRLEGQTSLRIESISDDLVEVRLRRGRIHARVRPDSGVLRVVQGRRSVSAADATLQVSVDDEERLTVEAEEGEVAVVGIPGAGRVRAGERLIERGGRSKVVKVSAQPLLDVQWPEGSRKRLAVVRGQAEPGSNLTLRLASRVFSTPVDLDGAFEVEIPLAPGEQEVEVEIVDPLGRQRRTHATLRREAESQPKFRLDLDYGGGR